MLKLIGSADYYPTPESLLTEITECIDWEEIEYVLEPSAGKGDIAAYVQSAKEAWSRQGNWRKREVDIDCIELEPDLRAILKEKGYRVVHDNFLTYETYKHYDLVIMNPPFRAGARHLLKAIEVQSKTGGWIICLLNAETLRNPYTNERKELGQQLAKYGAEVKYHEKAFIDAERVTDVEVASVKVLVPSPERETTIFDTLREKEYEGYAQRRETSELAEADIVRAFVAQYKREVEWGLRLYDELLELRSKSLDETSCLTLKTVTGRALNEHTFSVNEYVRSVRRKYWEKFFKHPVFLSKLTSNLAGEYSYQVSRFAEYDFSLWNVKSVQEEVARRLIKGVEDCIIELFDELSSRYAWDTDLPVRPHWQDGTPAHTVKLFGVVNRSSPLASFQKGTGSGADQIHVSTVLIWPPCLYRR